MRLEPGVFRLSSLRAVLQKLLGVPVDLQLDLEDLPVALAVKDRPAAEVLSAVAAAVDARWRLRNGRVQLFWSEELLELSLLPRSERNDQRTDALRSLYESLTLAQRNKLLRGGLVEEIRAGVSYGVFRPEGRLRAVDLSPEQRTALRRLMSVVYLESRDRIPRYLMQDPDGAFLVLDRTSRTSGPKLAACYIEPGGALHAHTLVPWRY